MFVQVHTDNHIKGGDALNDRVQAEIDATLGRFDGQVTSVQVHLNDLNGHKHGIDKRCLVEVRLSGHQPVTASHDATTIDEALAGAVEKVEKGLDHTLDRLDHRKGATSMGGDQKI